MVALVVGKLPPLLLVTVAAVVQVIQDSRLLAVQIVVVVVEVQTVQVQAELVQLAVLV